jgi:hypothetical protein
MGWVYFFRDCSLKLVKIGATEDEVESRRDSLQTGNPSRLRLERKIQTSEPFGLENLLHRSFEAKRVSGDFFDLAEADLNEAERIARYFEESRPIQERVELLKKERDNGILIKPLELHRDLVERWREAKREFNRAKLEKERLELQLQSIIGVHAGIEGLVTWRANEKHWFDQTRLEIDHPEIYLEYWKIRIERKLLAKRQYANL